MIAEACNIGDHYGCYNRKCGCECHESVDEEDGNILDDEELDEDFLDDDSDDDLEFDEDEELIDDDDESTDGGCVN